MIKFNDLVEHAKLFVLAEVASNTEASFRTVSAFVVVSLEGRFTMDQTRKADRQAAIKKTMMRVDMSNGKAAAYSKIVEALASEILVKHGQPDGAEISQFWQDWKAATEAVTLHTMARAFMDSHAKVDTLGQLADACGVAYGANKTAQKNKAELAKDSAKDKRTTAEKIADKKAEKAEPVIEAAGPPSKQAVLAAFLDLSANDQRWVIAAFNLATAHLNEVPEQVQIAA